MRLGAGKACPQHCRWVGEMGIFFDAHRIKFSASHRQYLMEATLLMKLSFAYLRLCPPQKFTVSSFKKSPSGIGLQTISVERLCDVQNEK